MIIIGDNLKSLIEQFEICSVRLYDVFSINIELDDIFYHQKKRNKIAIYEGSESSEFYEENIMIDGKLELEPNSGILACSIDKFSIPLGYIGFIQTKGSLARWFVTAHHSDGQVEPGFNGKITLEIFNHSKNTMELKYKAKVAQLFIYKCSTNNVDYSYKGKYNGCEKPTLPKLK
ncbi:MAG: hypothetical protein SCALA702_01820 [Melioribacteraceae bacterium]|nr:MAG: hypothetical protein SCALA702_01820 [Melioribacteraceae bacterium]